MSGEEVRGCSRRSSSSKRCSSGVEVGGKPGLHAGKGLGSLVTVKRNHNAAADRDDLHNRVLPTLTLVSAAWSNL